MNDEEQDLQTRVMDLVRTIEVGFSCFLGIPRAYHEVLGKQYPYMTLNLGAEVESRDDLGELADQLVTITKSLFVDLRSRGATRIFWRLHPAFTLDIQHVCDVGGNVLALRTRFAAVDSNGKQVWLPWPSPWTKEGMSLILSREELEDGHIDEDTEQEETDEEEQLRVVAIAVDPKRPSQVRPGMVAITCGCGAGSYCPQGHKGGMDHCTVWIDEMDLIRITHDAVHARFQETRTEEAKIARGES